MTSNVIKTECDRCHEIVYSEARPRIRDTRSEDGEIESLPAWLTLRDPFSAKELHLCVSCASDFNMFMEDKEAVSPRVPELKFGFSSFTSAIGDNK
jgi:hypothetical protein